jgi:isoleucyl-tRNA synthetase
MSDNPKPKDETQKSEVAKRAEPTQKSATAAREEKILAFWSERDIFNKSLEKEPTEGEYVFYEGPPTANGKPGIHHIESRSFKDVIPRYKTMRGYHVRRKAGWDTHGLPVEIAVEKEIGSKSKKDIEAYGIAKFNAKCKESVLKYIDDWKVFTDRIGYWVDHRSTYFTFDNDYIESVWSVLKTAADKQLVYMDYRIVPWCPRCGTGLSSHEVAQGYADVKDIAVTVKFKLKDPQKLGLSGDVYLLAWTTTPWTLPGNVALAVVDPSDPAKKAERYVAWNEDGATVIASAHYFKKLGKTDGEILYICGASDLIGLQYEPPFDYYIKDQNLKNRENGWKVYAADFVTADSGTGIAHEAPAFGADDWELAKRENLPFIQHVNPDGTMKAEVTDLAGLVVKPIDDPSSTDVEVLKLLQKNGALFAKEKYEHSYPHCWRCKTPLLYYARNSWYIRMSQVKETLIAENQGIKWQPEHIRDGRFGEWLKELKDWAISRSRYWGTPLPFWQCEQCEAFKVVGSVAELKAGSLQPIPDDLDLHRPFVDDFTMACECGGTMKRVPEVLDVWFDSGAMPFAQDHYPFENKAWVDGPGYPADYISEAIDQTRGWFYTLHAVGAGIMGRGKAYKNVICLGHILDAKGKKMSKSVGNIVEPFPMIDKYGVDALRYFMFTVNAPGDSKNFDERAVDDIVKKNIGRLHNVLAFYELYKNDTPRDWKSINLLDRWILSRIDQLVEESTKGFESYQLDVATRPIAGFIDDLSVWYLRRSRDRFKTDEDPSTELGASKHAALQTLRYVLHTLSRVMAPSMPFYAEYLFQAVREEEDEESVHLSTWPTAGAETRLEMALVNAMAEARRVVTLALEAREKANIKVRQPLSVTRIPPMTFTELPDVEALLAIIADEINVKLVEVVADLAAGTVELDTTISPELAEEGFIRELIRAIQGARKDAGLNPQDAIELTIATSDEALSIVKKHEEELKSTLKANIIQFADAAGEQQKLGDFMVAISVVRV